VEMNKRKLWLLSFLVLISVGVFSSYSFSQKGEEPSEKNPVDELESGRALLEGEQKNEASQEEAVVQPSQEEPAVWPDIAPAEEEAVSEEIGFEEESAADFEEEPLELTVEELDLEIPEELEFIEAGEVPGEETMESEQGRVNLIFKEADVTDVLAALAQQTGMNIIWGDEVKGIITLRLENVPWEQALDMVLKANKLTYEREENVIRVTTVARLNEEKEAELKLAEAEKEKEPLVTEVVTLNFSDAKEVKDSLEKVLSKRGSVVIDSRTNSLVITEIPSNFPEVKKVALSIDTQTPQVMIEARIVETSTNFTQDVGIDWAIKGTKLLHTHYKGDNLEDMLDKLGPYDTEAEEAAMRREIDHKAGSFESQFPTTGAYDGADGYGGLFKLGVLDAYDFEIAWQALETDAGTKILSNPRVATLHSKEAYIVVGEKIPIQKSETTETGTEYTVEYQDVGTKLTVTATINKEDMVTLKIQPEVSEIGEWKQLISGEYPIIQTKEADVEVLVQSGDTVVIGGLIYEKDVKTVAKIPFLGDIPLVGWAFKKQKHEKEDKEILVFVTPTVFGKKEKEEIAKELISFEGDEGVELVEKEKSEEEKKAFKEIEKELEDLEKEEKPAESREEAPGAAEEVPSEEKEILAEPQEKSLSAAEEAPSKEIPEEGKEKKEEVPSEEDIEPPVTQTE